MNFHRVQTLFKDHLKFNKASEYKWAPRLLKAALRKI